MAKPSKSQNPRPASIEPPEDIAGEALAEWHRVCRTLEAMGRQIKDADRSILALYCRTWAVNRECYEKIKGGMSVIKWPNGMPGPSPFYKNFKETAVILRGLLADIGCTPASRDFDIVPAAKPEDDGEIEF